MLSLTIKLIFRELLEVVHRAADALAALGAQRRSARRLDRLGQRLIAMRSKIEQARELLSAGHAHGPFDADGGVRLSLKELKEEIRDIRLQLSQLRGPAVTPRLQRAFLQLGAIAESTYRAADQLQWEIDAHDSAFSG